ncbi:MAG TPA: zinc-ribbon domain-containing protein [Candidatus Copromonas faecavium]|uniref:Zinc-ribbon domain-containing protein n=1 Tax=Candidatus Copromonas faecavium (nom. illeg.) TaxID=2840740 RepID=A0A9D1D5N6_9FIRM|nr:zinc-ribbon domain-containing protein [Candidatus Copromonas faecavium]
MKKTCPYCGAPLRDEASFCPHCAKSINSRVPFTPPPLYFEQKISVLSFPSLSGCSAEPWISSLHCSSVLLRCGRSSL